MDGRYPTVCVIEGICTGRAVGGMPDARGCFRDEGHIDGYRAYEAQRIVEFMDQRCR